MVDGTVNCPAREPRLRIMGYTADSKDGNLPILSGNGHVIAALQAAETAKHRRAVVGQVPGDDGRPKGTWCGPSSEPTSDGRGWRLHLSILIKPKLDQRRLDTDLGYGEGHWIRLRQNQPGDLVTNIALMRLRRRSMRAGFGRVRRSRRRAVGSRRTTHG